MKALVTGSNGFVGRNLCAALSRMPDVELYRYDLDHDPADLASALAKVGIVYHLAGVNRPSDPAEFKRGNADVTAQICDALIALGRAPRIVLSSSTQAELDNPYGASKREAEEIVRRYCERTGAEGVAYRLKNLFGKWCRPNYNSVTATFCHNIAHGLPIQISDPAIEVDLTYIDDVVRAFLGHLATPTAGAGFRMAGQLASRRLTLGELAGLIHSFHDHRQTLLLPDLSTPFIRALHATYLSYLDADELGYALNIRHDARGSLAEFIKSPHAGQIFVSRTRPGVVRGNHFHHTKTEKFMVLEGTAVIRLRQINGAEVVEFSVQGEEYRVVDIPPGYTHSIENVGSSELVTLFWSSEIFSPEHPDTYQDHV